MSIKLECYFLHNRDDVDYELRRTIQFPISYTLENLHQEIFELFNLDLLIDRSSPHAFYLKGDPFERTEYEYGTPIQNITDQEQIESRLRNLALNTLKNNSLSSIIDRIVENDEHEWKKSIDPDSLDIVDSGSVDIKSLELQEDDIIYYICDFNEVITIVLKVKNLNSNQINEPYVVASNGVPNELYNLVQQSYMEEIEMHERLDEEVKDNRANSSQKDSSSETDYEDIMQMFSDMLSSSISQDNPNVFNYRLSSDTLFMDFINSLAVTRVEFLLDLDREEFFDAIDDNFDREYIWTLKLGLYITSLKFVPINTPSNIRTYTEQITDNLTKKWGKFFYNSVIKDINKEKIGRLTYVLHLALLVMALSIRSIHPQYESVNSHIIKLIDKEDLKDDVFEGFDIIFDSLFDYFSAINQEDLEISFQIAEKRIHGGTRASVRANKVNLDHELYQRNWDTFSYPLDLKKDNFITVIDKLRRECKTGELNKIIEAASLGLSKEFRDTTVFEVIISLLLKNSPKNTLGSILRILNGLLEKIHEIGKNCTLFDRIFLMFGKIFVDYKNDLSPDDLETFYILSIDRWITSNHRKRLLKYGFKATKSEEFLKVALGDNAKSVRLLAKSYLKELKS